MSLRTINNNRAVGIALAALLLSGCASMADTPPEKGRSWRDQLTATPKGAVSEPAAAVAPADEALTRPAEDDAKIRQPATVDSAGRLPALPRVHDSSPPVPKVEGGDVVELNYEQVPLRQVLEEVADALGLSLVIDTSIADKVTVRTAPEKPLQHADLWALLRLLAADAGVILEKKGKVYHAKKAVSALPVEIGSAAQLHGTQAAEALQITPLRYITIESAASVLQPLLGDKARLVQLPNLNIIGIAGSPEQLARLNKLLELVDADPFTHRGMRLFRLRNASAEEVSQELEQILKLVEGETTAYQVLPLERVNGVLVVAPPRRGFTEVSRWVDILDEDAQEQVEQIFIYKVRNLTASSLGSTLSAIYQERDKSKRTPTQSGLAAQSGADRDKPEDKTAAKARSKSRASVGGGTTADVQVTIVPDEDTNSLLIRTTAREYRSILETIRDLDRVPQEVMINVVIAQVTLNDESRFGVELQYLFDNGSFVRTAFDAVTGSLTSGTGLIISDAAGRLTGLLNALATDNDVSVLARPSILVRNNQEATIKVGSEEPILTTITQTDTQQQTGVVQNDVQYRDTGIILTVTPNINEDGIINLVVSQELSQIGPNRTSLNLPSFTNQEIQTAAVVRDGDGLVLGGLIQTMATNRNTGVPGLRNVPVLGHLFSDRQQTEVRTELLLVIIPELIDPERDNARLLERTMDRLRNLNRILQTYEL